MMESVFPEPEEKPTTTSTLLSNLTGTSSDLFGQEDEADLFSGLDDPSPTVVAGAAIQDDGMPTTAAAVSNGSDPLSTIEKNVEAVSSKLASSGLLEEVSSDNNGGGGGLFDNIQSEPEPAPIATDVDPTSAPETDENNFQEMNLNESYGIMGVGGSIPVESAMPPEQSQQPPQGVMNDLGTSGYYSTSGGGTMHLPHHGQQPPPQQQYQYAPNPPQPSVLAGMHVGHDVSLGGVSPPPQQYQQAYSSGMPRQSPPASIANYKPPPFRSPYGKITVTDPLLIQSTGLFAGPPHWTFLVTLYSQPASNTQPQQSNGHQPGQSQPISAVRRRFRHFVALEARLRQSVPCAILPPRPDKHPGRLVDEASAVQSAEFAKSRAQELQIYMNSLTNHPHVAGNPELKLFLTLQDHIGTAWPEVSGSALTRLTAVGTASVEKLVENVEMWSELGSQQVGAGEDSAEILGLAAYEGRRMGSVMGSVPKMEGTLGCYKENGDRMGALGLESSKLSKDIMWCDRELSSSMDILSSALLRCGRRTKRAGLEMSGGIAPFVSQYKFCRYEQMAFGDRRVALKRRSEARVSADKRAAKVMMNQSSMGRLGMLEKMEMEAAMYDEMATEAAREAEEAAARLVSEVGRIGAIRVREWDGGMRVVAKGMKDACAENAAIWESALESFKKEFPEICVPDHDIVTGE